MRWNKFKNQKCIINIDNKQQVSSYTSIWAIWLFTIHCWRIFWTFKRQFFYIFFCTVGKDNNLTRVVWPKVSKTEDLEHHRQSWVNIVWETTQLLSFLFSYEFDDVVAIFRVLNNEWTLLCVIFWQSINSYSSWCWENYLLVSQISSLFQNV